MLAALSAGAGEHSTCCRQLRAGKSIGFALKARAVVMEKAEPRNCQSDYGDRDGDARSSGQPFHLSSERVRPEAERGRPRDRAQTAENQESSPFHPVDPSQQSRQRPKKGDEARDEDDASTIALKEIATEPQIALVDMKVAAISMKHVTLAIPANRASRDAAAKRRCGGRDDDGDDVQLVSRGGE